MKIDSLRKLYVHELKDLWSAEHQILDAMPALLRSVQNQDLARAFEEHLDETQTQVERLRTIFADLEFEPGGHRCKGMEGLLKEVSDVLGDDVTDEVRDAAIVAAAQRVEHYEMAGYGVARTFAEKLGDYAAADLLQKSLNEEAHADQMLTRLAERHINFEAQAATM
jgi:ferritin-like metal-binding protein YciE